MKKNLKPGVEYFDINLNKEVKNLPCTIKIFLENVIRNQQGKNTVDALLRYKKHIGNFTIDYYPSRVLMQDFTGVPAIVDLASLRDAVAVKGGDPRKVNPKIPVDLVIDHSIQVDSYGKSSSASENKKKEFQRNIERYQLLKWAQGTFQNFRVIPPGMGICHQINLEYLSQVVRAKTEDGSVIAYPDTLVGTDSHTTMSGGLAVLGWGVGGIEAESVMLGEPISMVIPEVIGLELTGKLESGVTSTDLVLHITHLLRCYNVVGKLVEVFGEGVKHLSIADRATIANMAPECGSTCNFFAPDQKTLDYLDMTGKSIEQIDLVESYTKTQTFWTNYNHDTDFTNIIHLDLGEVQPILAGPKRPQDKVLLGAVPENFKNAYPSTSISERDQLCDGSVIIAAITSCTNTSNPSAMLAAGLIAKKAVEVGLKTKPWVKTSLAPGSQVVSEYLFQSGLQEYLDRLGFNVVGYGCTTCIGNSGDLLPEISDRIIEKNLTTVAVLSGNRNFEGRIHPRVKANYLASPMLVVAYAIAGNININLEKEPLGVNKSGNPIYLKDILPENSEIEECISRFLKKDIFLSKCKSVLHGDLNWTQLKCNDSITYDWDPKSTYVKNPPFFGGEISEIDNFSISDAKIIALFGDSITTDHISPAGAIPVKSSAGEYLKELCIKPQDFNSYGARRGNHEVMIRGTFANLRVKNQMLDGQEGGYTHYFNESGERKLSTIYEAAMQYKFRGVPLVVFAGKEYGTGSSRDWAAKGTHLLGIKAVIAESFERIHRSNLVGMGVLPLIYENPGEYKKLYLTGGEEINIRALSEPKPMCTMECTIKNEKGNTHSIMLTLLVNTTKELEYLKVGSLLRYVLKESFLK